MSKVADNCDAVADKETTRYLYADRFGVCVLEGHGTTETPPIPSINTPTRNAPDYVGRFMLGVSWKLEPVEGAIGCGRLLGARTECHAWLVSRIGPSRSGTTGTGLVRDPGYCSD